MHRMRWGRGLVISGYVITVAGIAGYAAASFSAGMNPQLGSVLLEKPAWLLGPALAVLGFGTLLWLVGSFLYLHGAMDDPDGLDLH